MTLLEYTVLEARAEFSPLKGEKFELRALHFCPYCGAKVEGVEE
jgi:hypothetical protein